MGWDPEGPWIKHCRHGRQQGGRPALAMALSGEGASVQGHSPRAFQLPRDGPHRTQAESGVHLAPSNTRPQTASLGLSPPPEPAHHQSEQLAQVILAADLKPASVLFLAPW